MKNITCLSFIGCVTYEAMYDFPGELETHLTLHRGDVVQVHRKEDNGWWRGTVGDKTGWFPNGYVQAVLHGMIFHSNLDCICFCGKLWLQDFHVNYDIT